MSTQIAVYFAVIAIKLFTRMSDEQAVTLAVALWHKLQERV